MYLNMYMCPCCFAYRSAVTELSLEQLNEWLQSEEGVLVAFYGHECGHCKQMVPAFKQAAAELQPSGLRTAAFNLQVGIRWISIYLSVGFT